MTHEEVKLWNWLREEIVPAGYHFRRQVPLGRFVVDFACVRAKLIVEVDGEYHGFDARRRADSARDAWLAAQGYEVLRFGNHQINRERRIVLDTIYAALAYRVRPTPDRRSASTRPSPLGEGSGVEAAVAGVAHLQRPDPSPPGEGGRRAAPDGWGRAHA